MKFSLKDAEEFGWDGLRAWAVSSKENFSDASAIFFEVTKSHGKIKSEVSNRVYLVLSGSGRFVIDGDEVSVQKDDVVIVPKNTPYDYFADEDTTLRLFLVHTPAYDADREVQLDS